MKKKLLIGFILSISLICLYTFRHNAAALLIEKYMDNLFAGSFSFEKSSFDRHVVTFEKPTFIKGKAERAIISYDMDPFNRVIDVSVVVEAPSLLLEPNQIDWNALFATFDRGMSFFQVNCQMQIHNGTVGLSDSRSAYFSLESALGQARQGGSLTLRFDSPKSDDNSVTFHLFEQSARTQMELDCRQLNISDLVDIGSLIFPSWRGWNTTEGLAHGNLAVSFPKDSPPQIQGDLDLKNIVFRQSDWHINGNFQEVHFQIDPAVKGRFEILKPASFSFEGSDGLTWGLNQVTGGISLQGYDTIKVIVDGLCSYQGVSSDFELAGSVTLPARQFPLVDMTLKTNSQGVSPKSTQIAVRSTVDRSPAFEVSLTHFTHTEFAFFQSLLATFWPGWKNVVLRQGIVDATIQADFCDKGMASLKVKDILAESLDLDFIPWNASWKSQKLKGSMIWDLFDEEILHSLDGDLSITDGMLSWKESDNKKDSFESIQAELSIHQGVIQKTLVGMMFRGLKGKVELDGQVGLNNVQATFSGNVNDILPFVPLRLQTGLKQELSGHQIAISANLVKGSEGIEVKGLARIFEDPSKTADQIEFGLQCGEILDFTCSRGWFYAKNLSLEKYLAPFIIRDQLVSLTGIAEFKGTFDRQAILINYDAQDLVLKNDFFAIEVPGVASEASFSHGDPLVAYHRFDLATRQSEGVLPVSHGTYFEKNSGLLFTDIHSKIVFDGEVIRCQELEAFSNGVYLSGSVTADFSSPEVDVYSVDVNMPTVDGRVSQVQHMLSHFKESSVLSKIPVDGNFSFRGRGGHLRFDFVPGDYIWQGRAEGAISDGIMTAEQVDISLQDLCLEFAYDHQKNFLTFEDLQGTVLIGKKERVDEYQLSSDKLTFFDFRQRKAEFDIALTDKGHDFIRLAGMTQQKDSDKIEFLINHRLTHFGDIRPATFELVFKDWSELDSFRLQTHLQMSAFLRDLQRFNQTGFLCFSRQLLQQMEHLNGAEGAFQVDLLYDNEKSSLNYKASGQDISFHDIHFNHVLFNGKKQDKTWIIDQLQLDDISLAADLRCHHDAWNVHFLGLRYGNSLLLGMEGEYVDQGSYLDATVNLLEIDIARLDEWKELQSFMEFFHPEGSLHATGKMKVKFQYGPPWYVIDTTLQADLRGCQLKGCHVDDVSTFTLSYASDKGIVFRDFHATVRDDSHTSEVKVEAPHLSHEFASGDFSLEHLHFAIPTEHLSWAAETLHTHFPDSIDERLETVIKEIKKEGMLDGFLSLHHQGTHKLARLELPKGVYSLGNRDFRLSEVILENEGQDLRFAAKWHDKKVIFWLRGQSELPHFDKGTLTLIDNLEQTSPLRIQWEHDPITRFSIQKADGQFFGLNVALHHDPEMKVEYPWIPLQGDVRLDCRQALPLFPEAVGDKVNRWRLTDGYLLSGDWIIDQDNLDDLMGSLHFYGKLYGSDFAIKGYQFQQLSADIEYTPNQISIKDVAVADPAGSLGISELILTKDIKDQWNLMTPRIRVENLRPSLLKDLDKTKRDKVKPLVIRRLDLENCQGCISDLSTFKGKGSLYFQNPPKKNLRNTIFAIPAEILKRIGLDPSVMTPVTGTIALQMQGDKVYLNRMKDVYSEGRASKFYLARRTEGSWIDFDGNLFVQVRMKQYNLLFKLAELFTVTITGNLKKPVYNLQKQPHATQPLASSQTMELTQTE